MTSSNIFVNIIGEFKKKGFDDAGKATNKLGGQFDVLGKRLAAAFSIAAVTKFAKQSIKAFAEAEQEAAQLRTQLRGLNLEFASPYLNRYMDTLSLATGRSGRELTSSFVALSQATGDLTTAQRLMTTAMDISAATGKDLQTVSVALQRAYRGELTALTRLRIGITKADLEGRSFNDVLGELQEKFSGAEARRADTYAGKMARLAESGELAKEAFGKAFVDGIEQSNVALEDMQRIVIGLGNALGTATGKAVGFINSVFKDVENYVATDQGAFSRFVRGLVDVGGARRANEVAARAELRQRNVILRAEKKLQVERKKAIETEKKSEREKQALKRAGTVFDMENIQIVAAMQGRIDGEQRLRLTALLAIQNQNADAAEKLSTAVLATNSAALQTIGVTMKAGDSVDDVIKKIINSQAQLALVQLGITNLPKAKNPFEDWKDIMAAILSDIGRISAAINAIPKYNPTGSNYVNPSTTTRPNVAGAPPAVDGGTQWNLLAKEHTDAIIASAAASQMTDVVVDELTKRATMATLAANAAFTGLAEFKAREYGDVIVQVNVQGNVTTETDLVNAITDQLYQNQKTGKGLLFSSTAI